MLPLPIARGLIAIALAGGVLLANGIANIVHELPSEESKNAFLRLPAHNDKKINYISEEKAMKILHTEDEGILEEPLKGYVFLEKDGEYMPPVELNSHQAVFDYCRLQSIIFPEIRIVDLDDYTVMHVIDGEIIFPHELAGQNFRNMGKAQVETNHKPIPEWILGQWLKDDDIDSILNEYGDIPVVVKGGGDRGIFPLSEVKNEKAFIEKHPSIIYIREVWIPNKDNIKVMKDSGMKEYKLWYKHIKL